MPATAVPSTAPEEKENPLQQSLAKVTGKTPLSASAGTSTGVIGYDPSQTFRPQGDVISIAAAPGTGASTAETWAHEISLENLKREQLQFEYEQQQSAIANALKQQEAERSAQQQTFSQNIAGQTAKQQAEMAPVSLAQAKQALQSSQYDTALKQAQAKAAEAQTFTQLGGMTLGQLQDAIYNSGRLYNFAQGAPVGSPGLTEQFMAYANSPAYNQVAQPVWNANAQQWMPGASQGGYYKPPDTVKSINFGR